MLPPDKRTYGDVQAIFKSPRVPVTPQYLGQWYKKYRDNGKLTRKSGTGPRHIMGGDPAYREC